MCKNVREALIYTGAWASKRFFPGGGQTHFSGVGQQL